MHNTTDLNHQTSSGEAAKLIPINTLERLDIDFENAGIGGIWVVPDEIDSATASPGAYVVCFRLALGITVSLPRLSESRLPSGWYVYVGSARGNGGIRSRLKRHFKQEKAPHWHIDRLTVRAHQMAALALVDGDECSLVGKLLGSSQFQVALAGFGNSDCRRCESHLLTCAGL
ncbi:MAG: GIY-YIG nuclease family protein [Hyphomicrobiaceae bacterium]